MKKKIFNVIVSLVALIASIIVTYDWYTGRSFALPLAVLVIGDAILLVSWLTDKAKE